MEASLLSTDLFFSSRVTGVAEMDGVTVTTIMHSEQLIRRVSENDVRLVLLDLSMPELDPKDLVPRLRELPNPPDTIIAFGPHVHEKKLSAAREAGCDRVLSRGEFNNQIRKILTEYLIQKGHR